MCKIREQIIQSTDIIIVKDLIKNDENRTDWKKWKGSHLRRSKIPNKTCGLYFIRGVLDLTSNNKIIRYIKIMNSVK